MSNVYSLEGTAPFCGTPGCAPPGTKPAAPRFVGRSTLPPISVGTAPTTVTYPFLYPQNNFSVQWGLDNKIKTPYSETFDLSLQRELRGGVLFEAAYVGRLGRHLLQQLDFAQPVDYVDPKGAGDYYAAGSQLSRDVDLNGGNFDLKLDANGNPIGSQYIVAPIQYFENVFPFMAGYDYAGESATQAIYNNEGISIARGMRPRALSPTSISIAITIAPPDGNHISGRTSSPRYTPGHPSA